MSLFGGFPAASAAPATSAPALKPFGGAGLTISTPANPFAPNASAAAAPAVPLTTMAASTSLYPSLTASTAATTAGFGAIPAVTPAPSLFASAPAALSTGSLFSSTNSTAASNALSSATGKSILSSTTTQAAPALTPDTIAGSTKYTELPVDAKTMLDQFHSFLQGQIHLSVTLAARPSESLDKISKETEELSKRLITLNDALERDTKVIQALQDKVGQELKQADSAGRIIEAYANPTHANFLYAGNNSAGQYFMDQCQSFEEHLRQFRGSIEEIERHLASIGAKHPHVSHALPEVLRNQHEGFLAVASRVSTLHDEIKDKEKAYLMFRRKFFDDDSDPFQTNIKHRKTENSQHGQSLRSSVRSTDSQMSYREIAKETLRPGVNGPAVGAPGAPTAAPTLGSSLFGAPASTAAKPSFFGAAAPATSTASTGLFGAAPATTTASTGLFGAAPAAGASTGGLFGAPASGATSLFGANTSAPPTFSLTAPAAQAPGGLFGAPAATSAPFGGFKK
ncbi:Nucleoporin p58/p45 [Entomortierella beljakovae]|nr:Nucleoporin p58/p45 [Entomortierella beljakovae]